MDYINKYEFPPFLNKGGGGGIPLHIYGSEFFQNDTVTDQQFGGNHNHKSSLYFPGGLFVNPLYDLNSEMSSEKDTDPTTKNIFEQYDMFLDLASPSLDGQKKMKTKTKTKTKKLNRYKPKKISYRSTT